VEVLARVRSNQLRVVDASRLLGVSYRQAKRLWKRYREEGPASLKHRSAGCISNHAYVAKFRQRALDLVRKKYGGPVGERFGPTLAAEHLDAEDGLLVNAETLRLWMLEAGLWSRQRKRRKHRRRRERKEHFGELVRHGRRRDQHDLGAMGGTRDHLGSGRCAARVDRAVRRPLGTVRGLEELVQAASQFAGAFTRGRTDHAVWAHVREAGDRGDRSEFAGSQGKNRADARHASRPAGEETAAEADPQSRSGECVPAEGISARTQPAVRPCGGEVGRLPPAGTAGCGTGSDFPAGERADHRERLGGTLRESLFSAGAAEPPLCPVAEQGAGLRRTARRHQHRVSRSSARLEANCGAAEATAKGGGCTRRGSHWETEVGAAGGPPLARGGPARRAAKSNALGGPSTVGLALRFALNAPPFGLRRAPLRSKPTDRKKPRCRAGRAQRESLLLGALDAKFLKKSAETEKRARRNKTQTQKGDISKLV
jgi:helix-turn-helix protein